MNNQQILKIIANYSRVDLNEETLLEMGEELKDLNLQNFKTFVKNSLERAELQYTPKGLERFMKFVSMYKKEINTEREKEAQTQSQLLEDKFNKIKVQLKQEHSKGLYPTLEQLRANDTTFFSSFEISQLNAIGEPKYLISLSDSFDLQKRIEDNFVKLVNKKVDKQIESKPNKLQIDVKRF